jgi:outer membrane biosynthesis protein TonB
LVASTGIGLGLALVLANAFDQKNPSLKLSGFLGTVWAEGFPDKVEHLVEDPPIKITPTGDQPAYALLNPGTSPSEPAQEKRVPKPRPAPKPKMEKAPAPQAKGAESATPKPPKEQVAAKNKSKTAKKKKTTTPAKDKAAG